MNLSDTCHLKHLAWAIYNGTLLVGSQPELPGITSGAPCWQASSNTSTGATTILPTARLIPWHHGTVNRGLRHFVKSKDKVLHDVATRMDPGLGGEDQGEDRGAAPDATPGCQVEWGGVDTPAAPHPTCR